MTVSPRRTVRAFAATVLLACLVSLPDAAAVPAPIVDPSLLPDETEPGPNEPTEQRSECAAAVPAPDGPGAPSALAALGFASAWPLTRGGGQVVAVIDTGVAAHDRLPGLRAGGDFVSSGTGIGDCDAHGTVVAGIIAASSRDGSGFSGGAPDATILSIRQSSGAFSPESAPEQTRPEAENSTGYGDVSTMADAIRRAADLGATVINVSEVACGDASAGLGDGPLGAAVRYAAVDRDVVIVAAAGNLGTPQCRSQNPAPDPTRPRADPWSSVVTVASPAWFDDFVLTVGSLDADGSASDFSVAGPWVDVAAPGTDALSLSSSGSGLSTGTVGQNGAVVPYNGTSFAAPLVSATAALVRARYPQLTAAQVVDRIERTAHAPAEGWNSRVGHGGVDPVAAVTAPMDTGSAIPRYTDAAASLGEQLPPPATDDAPRNVALAGVGMAGLAAIVALLVGGATRRRQPPGSRDPFGSGSTPS